MRRFSPKIVGQLNKKRVFIRLSVAAGIIRGGFLDIIHEELNTIKKKVKSYFDFRKTYGAVNNGAKFLIV